MSDKKIADVIKTLNLCKIHLANDNISKDRIVQIVLYLITEQLKRLDDKPSKEVVSINQEDESITEDFQNCFR